MNRKKGINLTFFRHDVSSNFFDVPWRNFFSLVKFSYWFKCHVNIMTDTGVMTIFVYKGLTRNSEIRNTPVWVLPNIWGYKRPGQVRDTRFGTNISNKMLLNAEKCQGCSFYHFWVIKGKPIGVLILPPTYVFRKNLGHL